MTFSNKTEIRASLFFSFHRNVYFKFCHPNKTENFFEFNFTQISIKLIQKILMSLKVNFLLNMMTR